MNNQAFASKTYAFEDFTPGRRFELGPYPVTAEEIKEFAGQFDPQPWHLDEAAGKASILGGLAASGWHTCAMLMRMLIDAFIEDSTSQGAPASITANGCGRCWPAIHCTAARR